MTSLVWAQSARKKVLLTNLGMVSQTSAICLPLKEEIYIIYFVDVR